MQTTPTRKGISPLIAAVLLIAFTMAVAAILTAFVTTYTQETTSEVGNQSSELVQCAQANIDILGVNDSSGANPLNVTYQNIGRIDLSDGFVVTAFDSSDSFIGSASNTDSLNQGSVGSDVVSFSGTADQIRVRSIQCPEATAIHNVGQ